VFMFHQHKLHLFLSDASHSQVLAGHRVPFVDFLSIPAVISVLALMDTEDERY